MRRRSLSYSVTVSKAHPSVSIRSSTGKDAVMNAKGGGCSISRKISVVDVSRTQQQSSRERLFTNDNANSGLSGKASAKILDGKAVSPIKEVKDASVVTEEVGKKSGDDLGYVRDAGSIRGIPGFGLSNRQGNKKINGAVNRNKNNLRKGRNFFKKRASIRHFSTTNFVHRNKQAVSQRNSTKTNQTLKLEPTNQPSRVIPWQSLEHHCKREEQLPQNPIPTENMYLILSTLETKYSSLKQLYDTETKRYAQTTNKLTKERNQLERKLAQKHEQVEKLTSSLKSCQNQHYLRLEDHLSKIRDLEVRNKHLSNNIQELKTTQAAEVERLKAELDSKVKLQEIANTSNTMQGNKEIIDKNLARIEHESKEQEVLNELQAVLEAEKAERCKLTSENNMLSARTAHLETEITTLRNDMLIKDIDLEKISNEAKFVQKKLETISKTLSKKETQLQQAELVIQHLTISRDENIVKLQKAETQKESLEKEVQRLNTKLKSVSKETDEIIISNKKEAEKMSSMSQELSVLQRDKKVTESQLNRAQAEAKQLQKTVNSLQAKTEVQSEQLHNLQEALESLSKKEAETQLQKQELRLTLDKLQKKLQIDTQLRKSLDIDEFKQVLERNQEIAVKFNKFLKEHEHEQ